MMKRYAPEQQYIPADMTETEDGDYVLYDDIAALLSTALVPVPVGDECAIRAVPIGSYVRVNGEIGWYHGGDMSRDVGYIRWYITAEKTEISLDTLVQPVRLVPALETLEGKS